MTIESPNDLAGLRQQAQDSHRDRLAHRPHMNDVFLTRIQTDIHRMTALLTQVCRRTMVFARASLAWSAGMLRRPVTSARRVREAPKLPSSRGTSPMGLAGTDGDRTRVTLARDQAAAAVPRSAAGCQRINAVRWRPRSSGRRWSGRGARPWRRS